MWTMLQTPVGDVRVIAHRGALTAVEFAELPGTGTARSSTAMASLAAAGRPVGRRDDADPLLSEARRQLTSYFSRELRAFDLPLAPTGTPFQGKVWSVLRTIPYGTTMTYGEVAGRLGMTAAASRAVGLANGRNPIAIVVPCHRVVGADGTLTGYAGGMERKQFLLTLEQDALF